MSNNPISMSEYYRLRRIAVDAVAYLRKYAAEHGDEDALVDAYMLEDRIKGVDAATLYDRLEVK